jgi:hypothetical protein
MLAVLAAGAFAGTDLQITVDDARAAALGLDGDAIEASLASEVDRVFELADQEGFLGSMADAAAIAGRGIGVDYGSNPETFVIGGSIGTGANAQGLVFGRGDALIPGAGFALQVSAMAGLNLGVFAEDDDSFLHRVVVSAHGMALQGSHQRLARGAMLNAGGHVQLKLIGKGNHDWLEWGGLDLTAGYERSTYTLRLEKDLPLTSAVGGGTVTWRATGAYTLSASTDSFPVELSTNVRVSVITLFLGVGGDLVTGGATSVATLGGPVDATVGSNRDDVGRVDLALDWAGAPDRFVARVFVGPQLNLWPVKVYAQVSATTNASAAVHAGVRLAW